MIGNHRLFRRVTAGFATSMLAAAGTQAGPNLMAIGDYASVPHKRAEGRDTFTGKEIIFEFQDPAFDFGRVVVRSNQPNSVVRRDLFVGFSGSALLIDTQPGGGSHSVQLQEVEIWLRIRGRIRSGRQYEWEVEGGADRPISSGVPALIPMFWADGEQIAAEVTIEDPTPPDDGRVQRLLVPHGMVTLPAFRRQTGAAWVVLKLRSFGQRFALARFSFREVDTDLSQDPLAGMPIPVRYVPIRSVLEDRIARVLEAGKEALLSRRTPEFFWQVGNPEQDIQATATAASALGELGIDATSLRPTLDWLAARELDKNQPWSIPTIARRLYCLSRHGGLEDYGSTIQSDIMYLTDAQREGGWPASVPSSTTGRTTRRSAAAAGGGPRPDHAAGVLVLLALREGRVSGAEVDQRVWRDILQYWTDAQAYDGGFREKLDRYGGVAQATTTTWTAAGTASLIASLDMAYSLRGRRCTSYLSSRVQLRAMESALDWLDENYQEQFRNVGSWTRPVDPLSEAHYFITLGEVSGITHFNDKRHFVHSAEEILRHYDETTGMFGIRENEDNWAQSPSILQTAVSLEALGRGSAPPVCQRIVVGDDETGWAQYSGDAQHLARYLARRRGRQFNWRRMTIDQPVRDLVKTPILLLKAIGPFEWSTEEWGKIREYCLAGGTVLVDVADDRPAVREAAVSGLKKTFPEWALRKLSDDHRLFSIEDELETRPAVQTIGNGFREFLFLPGASWSCRFHLYQVEEYPETFKFMNNVLRYATDGTPLKSTFVASTYAAPAVAARTMTAASLEVGGKVPAYPNLIPTMDRLMQANYRLGVESAEDASTADLLWVSVTGEAAPSDDARRRMHAVMTRGAFLLADNVSGNKDWDENFRAFLRGLTRGVSVEKLNRNDPIFTGEIAGTQGFDVVEVELRKALHTRFSTRGRCDLYQIRFDGKTVGVYSAYDLASGIGYHYYPDCRGVMPEHARQIAMNAFLTAYGWKRLGHFEEQAKAGAGR